MILLLLVMGVGVVWLVGFIVISTLKRESLYTRPFFLSLVTGARADQKPGRDWKPTITGGKSSTVIVPSSN